MKAEYRVLALSLIAAAAVWVADAVADTVFFYKQPFLDLLILNVPLHEV